MPQVFDSNCWSCGRFRHEKCRFFNKGDVFDQSGFHSSALLLHCLLSHFLALFLFSQVLDSISFLPSTKRGRHLGSAGNLVWLLFCFVDWSHPRLQRKHHWSFSLGGWGVTGEGKPSSNLELFNLSVCLLLILCDYCPICRFLDQPFTSDCSGCCFLCLYNCHSNVAKWFLRLFTNTSRMPFVILTTS